MSRPTRDLIAWFDVSAGAAGDMICGALIDAGAPLDRVQAAVDAVIPAVVRLRAEPVTRAGLRATDLTVEVLIPDAEHRSWSTIRALLDRSALEPAVRASATAVFARLAEAEGRVHGIAADDVHFHEVGALDSIADVVGSCAALNALGIDTGPGMEAGLGTGRIGAHRIVAGSMALGSGHVSGAHGQLPVPVPAVLELVRGWSVLAGGMGELTTPTGAAIVTALAGQCGPLPALIVEAVGVGAGDRDTPGRANVVRIVIGRPVAGTEGGPVVEGEGAAEGLVTAASAATVLETNVDDLDPRIWPGVLARLLAAGASDAWLTPILMKKGRPAHTLSVLSAPDRVATLRALILRETSAIGLREHVVTKHALARTWVPVPLPGGSVRIKVATSAGIVVHATPEFEDVAALAEMTGRPVRDVLEEAVAAALTAELAPGIPGRPEPVEPTESEG